LKFTIDNCARETLFHKFLLSLGCEMLFATYVELDAGTNAEMRTGCHLIVKTFGEPVA
jgi:hypothetical protein